MEIKGIKYTGPIFDNSGYARACRGNILALHEAGVPITLNPISFESTKPDLGEDGKILHGLVNKQIPYNIQIIHTTPEFWSKLRDPIAVNVGYTIWETSRLHRDWPAHINNNVTKVLVGCEWNTEVFKDSGVTIPIGVVPHGINMKEFEDIEPFSIGGVSDDDFVFYGIFQWSERKNPEALIRAYYHAFAEKGINDVALVLKTYRLNYSEEEVNLLRNIIVNMKRFIPMRDYPKIAFISNMLSEEEISALHKRGDCYVSLDRGEGFGLSPFAAGAAGNPIIVTGYGGTTEYAKEGNSYLIDYKLTPVYKMALGPWYTADQLWADPDIVHASNLMRQVYMDRDAAKVKGERLQSDISEKFSWPAIAGRIVKELEEI